MNSKLHFQTSSSICTHSFFYLVWDSSIPKQRISEFGTFQAYGDHLASRLGSGDFAGEKSSWVSSLTTDTLRQNIDNDWSVPADWAQDSGDIDCSSVLWSGYLSDPGQDLLTSGYYETVAPIADKQIAKAGFRMATLLNMIFDKSRNCV